jgi:hypothetical protein
MSAIAACGGGGNQFRLLLEQKAPTEPKAGEVLYDPLDGATCVEILKSRAFYESHLRLQLNQRSYPGEWEDFWRDKEVVSDQRGSALVVVFHARGTAATSRELAEALAAALNEYHARNGLRQDGSPPLVKAIEPVK